MIKQLSVFIENKKGSLLRITKTLTQASIDIRALSVADTSDFGILRIIVDDEEKALSALRKDGYIVSETDVCAVEAPDRPGALCAILEVLSSSDISVEYVYAFLSKKGANAFVVIRADDTQAAEKKLAESGMNLISKEDIT